MQTAAPPRKSGWSCRVMSGRRLTFSPRCRLTVSQISVNLHAHIFVVCILPRLVMSVGQDGSLTRHEMTTSCFMGRAIDSMSPTDAVYGRSAPESICPKCSRSAPSAGSFPPNRVGIRVHLCYVCYIVQCAWLRDVALFIQFLRNDLACNHR